MKENKFRLQWEDLEANLQFLNLAEEEKENIRKVNPFSV